TEAAAQNGRQESALAFEAFELRLPVGILPEYKAKEILRAAGIPTPRSAVAHTLEEAQSIAAQIGYPVVLKAQSADLSHKSDVGGVVLDLADQDALSAAWKHLHENIARLLPNITLDGVLVEQMSKPGAELIVGARKDPEWGPVLLVGFGGVLAEALRDIRLLPPDLGVEAIINELLQLKSAAVLRGFRGSPALNVRAVAEIVQRVGNLMRSAPEIQEIDINPLLVYPEGQEPLALDALMVTRATAG
ncbi:MAG: acetate--CoA ligase family protein, partial [Acidobacteriaceae bacterium]|nr:acetate--CoA ligase family protein [Acidobacteriaceae bacterium]